MELVMNYCSTVKFINLHVNLLNKITYDTMPVLVDVILSGLIISLVLYWAAITKNDQRIPVQH